MDEKDPTLDPGSSEFDAKKAIYSVDAEKEKDTKSYDSVEQCITAIFNKDKASAKQKNSDKPPAAESLERRFLPEQMAVPSRRVEFRHVLTRMEEFKDGPLGRIRQWKDDQVRVKVWTRGQDQIRGYATGFIAGFDKHWNLVLTDVDEHFNRLRKRKTIKTSGISRPQLLPADLPVEFRVGESVLRVVRIQGKHEVCVRHVPQVLLRGEHVVMIALVNLGKPFLP